MKAGAQGRMVWDIGLQFNDDVNMFRGTGLASLTSWDQSKPLILVTHG